METREELIQRRTRQITELIADYSRVKGYDTRIENLSPYQMRVCRCIRSMGKRINVDEGTTEEGFILTGSAVGIFDIYPTNMRWHDLSDNTRGGFTSGGWKDGIKKLLDKNFRHGRKTNDSSSKIGHYSGPAKERNAK